MSFLSAHGSHMTLGGVIKPVKVLFNFSIVELLILSLQIVIFLQENILKLHKYLAPYQNFPLDSPSIGDYLSDSVFNMTVCEVKIYFSTSSTSCPPLIHLLFIIDVDSTFLSS
jgi:hypothetical protein